MAISSQASSRCSHCLLRCQIGHIRTQIKPAVFLVALISMLSAVSIFAEEYSKGPDRDAVVDSVVNAVSSGDKPSAVAVLGKKTLGQSGILLVSTLNGDIHVLDPSSGDVRWTVKTSGNAMQSFQEVEDTTATLVPSVEGNLFQVDASSGSVERLPTTVQQFVEMSPTLLDDGTVISGSKISESMIVDASSGRIRKVVSSVASRDVCETEGLKIPVSSDPNDGLESLVVNIETHVVRAVDPATGLERWNVSVAKPVSAALLAGSVSIPSRALEGKEVLPNALFVSTSKSLLAVDQATKMRLWSMDFDSPPVSVWTVSPGSRAESRLLSYAAHGSDEDISQAVLVRDSGFVMVDKHKGSIVVRDQFLLPSGQVKHEKNERAVSPESPSSNALSLPKGHALPIPVSKSCSAVDKDGACLSGLMELKNSLPAAISDGQGREDGHIDQWVDKHADPVKLIAAPPSNDGVLAFVVDVIEQNFTAVVFMGILVVLAMGAALSASILLWTSGRSSSTISKESDAVEPGKSKPPSDSSDAFQKDDNNNGNEEDEDGISPLPDGSIKPMSKAKKRRMRRSTQKEMIRQSSGDQQQSISASPIPSHHQPPKSVMGADGKLQVGRLNVVPKDELGKGSHGTVVYAGELDGRRVAVKRMLHDFTEVAHKEIDLLINSDDHPSVVRYFAKEMDGHFIYLALELCEMTLSQLVDDGAWPRFGVCCTKTLMPEIHKPGGIRVRSALQQLVAGVVHLHNLKIVHRDLKPANVLVSSNLKFKISDMGLSKKLEMDQSSFETQSQGSFGWRPPELIAGTRCGRSVDIFALGCVIYYVLTGGRHPFGARVDRESNIMAGRANTSALKHLPEAESLVKSMIVHQPRDRPSAASVHRHPFFWSARQSLSFIHEFSDFTEPLDNDHPIIVELEKRRADIFSCDGWDELLDPLFIQALGSFRKYKFTMVRDLCRTIRNKRNHYRDMPEDVQKLVGPLPGGYLRYFTSKFPALLPTLHSVAETQGMQGNEHFRAFFDGYTPDDKD